VELFEVALLKSWAKIEVYKRLSQNVHAVFTHNKKSPCSTGGIDIKKGKH
jgi:hypothetical protein